MFKEVPEDEAVIVEGGVFKPAPVYIMGDAYFVKAKGGFVRVKSDGSTSHPNVRLYLLAREAPLWADAWGRLCAAPGPKRKQVLVTGEGDRLSISPPQNDKQKLTG